MSAVHTCTKQFKQVRSVLKMLIFQIIIKFDGFVTNELLVITYTLLLLFKVNVIDKF